MFSSKPLETTIGSSGRSHVDDAALLTEAKAPAPRDPRSHPVAAGDGLVRASLGVSSSSMDVDRLLDALDPADSRS